MQAEQGSLDHLHDPIVASPITPRDIYDEAEAIRGRRRVQWGPNQKKTMSKDETLLDEAAKNTGVFSTLRKSLTRHQDSLGRKPETSPSRQLSVFVDADETEGLPALTQTDTEPEQKSNEPEGEMSTSWPRRRTSRNSRADPEIGTIQEGKPVLDTFESTLSKSSGVLSTLLFMHDRQPGQPSPSSPSSSSDTPLPPSSKRDAKRSSKSRSERPRGDALRHSIENVFSLLHRDDVPEEAGTGAGVFGPLVAATGNLASVAAPTNASLAPDLTRPGYRLSRYSHAEKSPPSSRPQSLRRESGTVSPDNGGSRTPRTPSHAVHSALKASGISSALKSMTPASSRRNSPHTTDTEGEVQEVKRKRRKTKRKRDDIYITMHIANIVHRQNFILKLARAFLMFGAPSHRIESQIQATARILSLNVSSVYLPNLVLISFNDTATGTSNIKFIKQSPSLDLGKLVDAYALYWCVIHDKTSVSEASEQLDVLMLRLPIYRGPLTVLIGGFCSAFICPIAFRGSFVDALIAFPLGALLVYVQTLSAKNELYNNVFDLFLGFGLAMGAEVYHQVSKSDVVGNSDFLCQLSHRPDGPWWQRTPSAKWAFLCAPMYSLFLTLRNQAPFWEKELYVSVLIACGGWTANHFASARFVNRSDISSAIGAFVVGVAGHLYGRLFQGNAFVVMITGILFQLPSGLSNGGLLAFASQSTEGSATTYASGFGVAEQLVSVAVGLTVGLFIAAVVVHPWKTSRRGTALFAL
ncbi:hypothetical protein PIIN_00115 [Serendipita indica DSM 11827]|uniref:DUF1212-domain-containing protein n=1 Tax=Serendipita indica (strain DSM 11827) TaxID=1109443 RepID=G4T4T5_SERID|nr:hypothetical protein PIIN_00115 [Serendipita indica DSM 11827]